MVRLSINGKLVKLDVDGQMPLLWALREAAGLTGTKYGCDDGLCGACTVLIDDKAVPSCAVAVSTLDAKQKIVTIEGLSANGDHPVQKAWLALDVAQCGYCQSGTILAAVALLKAKPTPTDTDINEAMTNLCRCGTYNRIRAAVHKVAADAKRKPDK
ncbi:MAG: (2Fe-2S)-binding protein [Hyphomicrobiaceae bacterium]